MIETTISPFNPSPKLSFRSNIFNILVYTKTSIYINKQYSMRYNILYLLFYNLFIKIFYNYLMP